MPKETNPLYNTPEIRKESGLPTPGDLVGGGNMFDILTRPNDNPINNENLSEIPNNELIKLGKSIFTNPETGKNLRLKEIKKNESYISFVKECIDRILGMGKSNNITTDIKSLQRMVGEKLVDGVFGPKTFKKTEEYLNNRDKKRTSEQEIIEENNNVNNGFDISAIRSFGIEYTPSGKTKCSGTAYRNLIEKFHLNKSLPRKISAFKSMIANEYRTYIPTLVGGIFTDHYIWDKENKPQSVDYDTCHDNESILEAMNKQTDTTNANLAEIYLSGSRGKQGLGHRAALYKGTDGQRYVLDPYVGGAGTKPQPLANYIEKCTSGNKGREIYRINLFQSQA